MNSSVPKTAAVYLRVSTAPQLEKFGPAVQAAMIERYAQTAGLTVARTYQDAITGKAERRTELDSLLREARQYDAVIISTVDRLARRVPICYSVLAELLDVGLSVHTTDVGPISEDDDNAMMSFGYRAVQSDSEHRRLVRRMAEGKRAKVRAGQTVQRLRCYGWRAGEMDPAEAHWLNILFRRLASEGSPSVAAYLNAEGSRTRTGNLWTADAVREIAENPLYKGVYVYGLRGSGRHAPIICPVPAIVSEVVWDAANAAMRERRTNKRRVGERVDIYPLMGRLTCSECGGSMTTHTGRPGDHYYRCVRREAHERRARCTHSRHHRAESVHAAIEEALERAVTEADALAAVASAPPRQALPVPTTADVTRRLAKLDAAYEADAFTPAEYAERRRALLTEREALTRATRPAPHAPDVTLTLHMLHEARTLPLAERARALNLRAVLHPGGEIEVSLNVV